MAQTDVHDLRYPVVGDTPDVPRDIKYLADDVERELVEHDSALAGLDTRLDQAEVDIDALQGTVTMPRVGLYLTSGHTVNDNVLTTLPFTTVDANHSPTGYGSYFQSQGSGVWRILQSGVYAVSFRVESCSVYCEVELYNDTIPYPVWGQELHTNVCATGGSVINYFPANTNLKIRAQGVNDSGTISSGVNATWWRMVRLGA